MNPKTRQQVEMIVKDDHVFFDETTKNFQSLVKGDRPLYAAQQFDDIRRIIEGKLAQHFACEEEVLFPALLADNPSPKAVQLIAELPLEHPPLLEEARSLSRLLRDGSPTGLSDEFWTGTMRFLNRLALHTLKEEQLFDLFS